mgnify:CR=1 FL=1
MQLNRIALTLASSSEKILDRLSTPAFETAYAPQNARAVRPTLLLVKTTESRVDDAIARIVELHPYELPECIAVETRAGLPAYLDWIRAQTREDTD